MRSSSVDPIRRAGAGADDNRFDGISGRLTTEITESTEESTEKNF
jgi:hypothetical protein